MKALITTIAILFTLTCTAQHEGQVMGKIYVDTTQQKLFYDESSGPIIGYMVRVTEMKSVWKLDKNKKGFWMPVSGKLKETFFLDKNRSTRLPKPLYVN